MKRNIFIISLLGLLLTGILYIPSFCEEKMSEVSPQVLKYRNQTINNIKILANALELYANDHHLDYPSEKEFYSKDFYPYINKVLGKKASNPELLYNTPPKGQLKYTLSKTSRSFKLSCQNPSYYGLKALYFSPDNGLVCDDGSPKKGIDVTKEMPKYEDVTPAEKEEMLSVIQELHQAFFNKDLEKIMEICDIAFRRSGKQMEDQGKYTAEEVYYSYKGSFNDMFRAEGFKMNPLDTSDLTYRKKDHIYEAVSVIPVISSSKFYILNNSVRLRVGLFQFERIDGKLRITKMNLY